MAATSRPRGSRQGSGFAVADTCTWWSPVIPVCSQHTRFAPEVAGAARLHVSAKRALVALDPSYMDVLGPPQRTTWAPRTHVVWAQKLFLHRISSFKDSWNGPQITLRRRPVARAGAQPGVRRHAGAAGRADGCGGAGGLPGHPRVPLPPPATASPRSVQTLLEESPQRAGLVLQKSQLVDPGHLRFTPGAPRASPAQNFLEESA